MIDDARQEIKRCSGTQFDPFLASVFLKIDTSCSTSKRDKVAVINT
jgi:response regulator RpfG family c-di-GMP phosphodiesterase